MLRLFQERRIIRRLFEANATRPDNAVWPADVRINEGRVVAYLLHREVLGKTPDGRFYLHVETARRYWARRMRVAVWGLVLLFALWAVYMIMAPRLIGL